MRKIYLAVLFLLLSVATFAQRQVDMSYSIVKPALNATVTRGEATAIEILATNHGPASIFAGDTLVFGILLNNKLATVVGAPISSAEVTMGQAIRITGNLTLNTDVPTGAMDFCILGYVYGGPAGSATDPVSTNNSSCMSISYVNGTTGIGSAKMLSEVIAFPNPAADVLTVRYELGNSSDVAVRVLDLTGKVIRELKQGLKDAGQNEVQINVSDLAAGLYLYEIQTNTEKTVNKFNVVK